MRILALLITLECSFFSSFCSFGYLLACAEVILEETALDLGDVLAGVDVRLSGDTRLGLVVTVLSIFTAGEVVNSKGSWRSPSHFSLNAQQVLAHFDAEKATFAPKLTPRVADNPIRRACFGVRAPARNGNNMISRLRMRVVRKDASHKVNQLTVK